MTVPELPAHKEVSIRSLLPAALSEARGTRVSISLFLLAFSFAAGVGLGREWGRGVTKAELKALEISLAAQHAANMVQTDAVKEMIRSLDVSVGGVSATTTATDGRVQQLAGEVQVVKSFVSHDRR